MARPRAFDDTQALRAVRELFWDQGYAATSMEEITRVTGVGRQSLYDTFGSKEELFAAALRDYRSCEVSRVAALLEGEERLRERLTRFFDALIDIMLSAGGRGCFITNTLSEKSSVGERAAAILDENAMQVEAVLRRAVRAAQRAGELPAAPAASLVSAFLFNTVLGLSAHARLGADRRKLRSVVQVAIDAIG